MIDFASLILGPAMAVFGNPVTVTPTKSQPGAAAYAAPGIYDLKAIEIPLEGTDLFQQTFQSQLGIRLSDYPVAPKQGDTVAITQGAFEVVNVLLDGQGGATLILRALS